MIKKIRFSLLVIISIQLFSQENINKGSNPYGFEVYDKVDKQPVFKDGEKGLLKFYQANSEIEVVDNDNLESTIYFSIVIDEKGQASNLRILIGDNEDLIEQTEKIVQKMPAWTPGVLNGKKVKVQKRLSITYKN